VSQQKGSPRGAPKACRKTFLYFVLILGLAFTSAGLRADGVVRPPAVAGQFYPSSAEELRLAVDRYLEAALPSQGGAPLAIIVPHASYAFCGQIIADAFTQAAGANLDLIIILGPNHTIPDFRGVSVYAKGRFHTPLGDVPIDEDAAAGLMAKDADCVFDVTVHEKEHSIEVEIPFVQRAFPKSKILPIVIGNNDLAICLRLGEALAEITKQRKVLIVASSDLSHYPDYETAGWVDRETLKAAAVMDPVAFQAQTQRTMKRGLKRLETCACGEGPILTAMFAARELGVQAGSVISYINAGDAAMGDADRVVGYGAVEYGREMISPDTSFFQVRNVAPTSRTTPLADVDKEALLLYARKCIEWWLTSQTTPLARGFSTGAQTRAGVFVTLKKHGELRGCIGHLGEDVPLCRAVGSMALQAAFQDHRFRSVEVAEMKNIVIEISALTPMHAIADPSEIVVGRDGVFLRRAGRSAVFLPQVATEQGWSREEMLNHLCRKAGLDSDSWREGAELSTFQAVVFSESSPR
jgi:MEMO1 family protein